MSESNHTDSPCTVNRKPAPLEDRLWRNVKKSEDGCWEFRSAAGKNRYGYLSLGRDGKGVGAHVLSWELHNDRKVPTGMMVCHTCDNRACVRPDHLFLGTNIDNVLDMMSKDRHQAGTRHYKAKLTKSDAEAIYAAYMADDGDERELASRFNVSLCTINRVTRCGYLIPRVSGSGVSAFEERILRFAAKQFHSVGCRDVAEFEFKRTWRKKASRGSLVAHADKAFYRLEFLGMGMRSPPPDQFSQSHFRIWQEGIDYVESGAP